MEENTLTLGARGRSSSKKKHRLGYKTCWQQLRVQSRKNASSLLSSHLSSSEYEVSSDDDEKGPTVDKRHKGSQKAINSVNRSRRNKRDVNDNMNDVNSDDNGQEEQMTRRSLAKGVRKGIFDDTSSENKEVDKEDNEDYDEREQEQEPTSRWKNEMRKMENEITELKRKNKSLETSLLEMRQSNTPSQSKIGWTGEEINFVKDVNDFCKDRLYPKEKFLRKNWQ